MNVKICTLNHISYLIADIKPNAGLDNKYELLIKTPTPLSTFKFQEAKMNLTELIVNRHCYDPDKLTPVQ